MARENSPDGSTGTSLSHFCTDGHLGSFSFSPLQSWSLPQSQHMHDFSGWFLEAELLGQMLGTF